MEAKMDWTRSIAGWQVAFRQDTAILECTHGGSGCSVRGELTFTSNASGDGPWTVSLPRDSVRNRLALCDARGTVRGYLQFSGKAGALTVRALHRPAQTYCGTLAFNGVVVLPGAFACRTDCPERSDVVQMASGPADSTLNDSLFAPETDTLLRLRAEHVSIHTDLIADSQQPISFHVAMQSRPESAGHAALTIEIEKDYYRSSYVPYYTPIDRSRCPSPPTGWMSWNVYFDQAGEKENLDEALIGAELLKPFGLAIWSIESWQAGSDTQPVRDFDHLSMQPHEGQFPHGMKWLAEEIKKLGFVPGIWTAPFGTGSSEWYEAHRGWFLHDAAGKPLSNWCGRFLLDPSQPAVRRYLEQMHRVMADDWGYEFFKIDGMANFAPHYSALYYELDEVRAAFARRCDNPFELCVQALRRGIGPDRVLLCCYGHYTGPEVAVGDAARLGGDIVSPGEPSNWHNVLSQASVTLRQLFVHNIVWYGDPDTLLVGDYHTLDVARITATVVALPGLVMFSGDKLRELAPDRMRLIQQALPVCDVHPLDLFPICEMKPIWDLKIRRSFGAWDVVSIFNWDDEERNRGFQFAELGLDDEREYVVYDFWNSRFLGYCSCEFCATVAPRSNLLLAIHLTAGRPQFLSTDRHITQGGTCLKQVVWDADTGALEGKSDFVANHPTRLTVLVPNGWRFVSVDAERAEVLSAEIDADGVLKLLMRSEESCEVAWTVHTAALV